ncbi:uncharacterized protein LOC143361012 [Halictus rubicundus]|uniref:uncharacterized protein LOC143361012 n=1 Tax=Halictus rubicundus TaxID=77578 RepID=UPI004036FA9F
MFQYTELSRTIESRIPSSTELFRSYRSIVATIIASYRNNEEEVAECSKGHQQPEGAPTFDWISLDNPASRTTSLAEGYIASDAASTSGPSTSSEGNIAPTNSSSGPLDVLRRQGRERGSGTAQSPYESSKVDLLLGEYLYYKLLGKDRIRLQNETVVLQDTELGWVLSGEINDSVSTNINCHLNTQDLDAQLERFWQVEQCSVTNSCSPQEQLCEELFKQSTYRDKGGRYIVRLPFNDNKQQLGNSYDIALKRFYSLERRLQSNTELRDQYTKFLTEYEALDHMTEVEDKDFKDAGCYLPHHPIIKASSLTTKVRVVFDASAKTDTGLSLNHALMVGPTIQDDVFSLIARFRKYQYVITADIEKMFRQILVHPEDANYQKILWRKGPNEAVKSYRLNTVTYGTACAPFLAARCLQQLAEDEARSYPLAVEVIKNDFYMDDLLTGTNSSDEAAKLIEQLTDIFQRGGMNLRQWSSNKPQLLKGLQERTTDDCLCLDPQAVKKTLGIYWHPREDTIGVSKIQEVTNEYNWRHIISSDNPADCLSRGQLPSEFLANRLWQKGPTWLSELPTNWPKTTIPNIDVPEQRSIAIHLELVSELSTEAFIATLRRFFSRRGYASTIYSDNGTNFVGAKNKLDEIQAFLRSEQHKKPINSYLNSNGISCHFSPPRTPHFGGLWEAAVKTFKHHMYRTIGDTLFSFEVFNTYIIEIEAILNSRPLTPLSSDPNDLSALTPAHFLIGESLTNIPERDVSDIATNRLSVWEHIQKMKQHFWTRWYKEYLNELNIRSKWRNNPTAHLHIGTLILLKEDNLPPLQWKLGRITEIHPGEDNVIRPLDLDNPNRL